MTGQFNMMKKEETYSFLDARKDNEANVSSEDNKRLLNKRKNMYPLCGLLLSLVLVAWLIGLTMVREFQLNTLRKDVDNLKEQMTLIKQKVEDYSIVDEIKGFEGKIKADDEKQTKPIRNPNTFADIYDDDDASEEDEEDLENSGDWSFDDSKHEQIDDEDDDDLGDGDFLGEIMEAKVQDRNQYNSEDSLPSMKKLIRIMKMEDEEKKKEMKMKESSIFRGKRDIIAETRDGVPILEEPYHVARMLNFSRIGTTPKDIGQPLPTRLTSGSPRMLMDWDDQGPPPENMMMRKKSLPKKYQDPSTTTPPGPAYLRDANGDYNPNRKVIRIRKPVVRSGLASDYNDQYLQRSPSEVGASHLRRRPKTRSHQTHRNLEMAHDSEEVETVPRVEKHGRGHSGRQGRPTLVAAHFGGFTENYTYDKFDDQYKGNGKLKHGHEVPYTAWKAAHWLSTLQLDKQFELTNGGVTIPESGIYFFYVQVYFHDTHNTSSYKVFRSNGVREETILQCTVMTYTNERIEKGNTCFTAGAFHLNKGETLAIKNLGGTRYSIMQPEKSFFGLIKLADHNHK